MKKLLIVLVLLVSACCEKSTTPAEEVVYKTFSDSVRAVQIDTAEYDMKTLHKGETLEALYGAYEKYELLYMDTRSAYAWNLMMRVKERFEETKVNDVK